MVAATTELQGSSALGALFFRHLCSRVECKGLPQVMGLTTVLHRKFVSAALPSLLGLKFQPEICFYLFPTSSWHLHYLAPFAVPYGSLARSLNPLWRHCKHWDTGPSSWYPVPRNFTSLCECLKNTIMNKLCRSMFWIYWYEALSSYTAGT